MNLLLAQVKPYLYGALVIAITLGVLYINGQFKVRDDALAKVGALESQVKSTTAILETERKSAAEANDRAKQTQLEKQVIENEAQANRTCIANKSCGVRTELKYQTCPTVSSANASGSGSDELQEQNRRDSQLWINDLKESVRLDNLYIVKLQEDVRVRSAPDYCKNK